MLSAFVDDEPVEIRDMDVHAALELRRDGVSELLVVRRISGEFARVLPENLEFRYESPQAVEIVRAGTRVGILPERGGLVSSLSIGGTELLYMDRDTLLDASQNVKGGIPYLFPNAGPITADKQRVIGTALPQHGFARTLPWESLQQGGHTFVQELRSERVPTRSGYPGDWRVVNTVSIEVDRSARLAHRVENLSDAPLPVSSGLHPYFRVPGDKRMIAWDFAGGEEIA
jgi:galactose mutarotase-like enzyme